MHKFSEGDKIQFLAKNGLFYSCNRLSRNKTYIIIDFQTYSSYNKDVYYIRIENDVGDIIKINNDNFDNIQLLREEKLKNLLGG